MTRTRTPTSAEYAHRKYVRDPRAGHQPKPAKPMSMIDVQLDIAKDALTRTLEQLASAKPLWLRDRLTEVAELHRQRVARLLAQKAADEAGEGAP
ncbi:MAG TPA: hypothetical protein VD865_13095 [Stenotrophomonas sp.]|nr:hypothetical protein [Stenotrophomonas sp.]